MHEIMVLKVGEILVGYNSKAGPTRGVALLEDDDDDD